MTPSHNTASHRMPPPSAAGRVIVAGSINIDVAAAARFPQPGETVAGTTASLAKGCDLTMALNDANDAAAVSVRRPGAGPSMPTPTGIAALSARSDNAA